MNRRKLYALAAGTALLALTAGCGGETTVNVNANNANRAANANNANAVVLNANNANTAGGAYNRNYNTRADYDRENENYRAEARNRNESIGQGLEDGWIHFKTRAALATVDDLRDSTINVDVDNNVVTLRGTVANDASKAAAVKAAKAVEGVKSVNDKLTVNPNAGVLSGNGNANRPANSNR
jgi:hypothetical protein